MTGDQTVNLLWGIGALVLVLSALSARRLSIGAIVRSLLGWAVIAVLLWFVMANRFELQRFAADTAARFGLAEQTTDGETVRIRQSPDGHFYASAILDGTPVRMMIDSGATITAISDQTARNVGIETGGGFPVMLTTANGTIAAERGAVGELQVEGIRARDLGVVVSPAFGSINVLGMNFLSRMESWRVEGGTLILVPPQAPPAPSPMPN